MVARLREKAELEKQLQKAQKMEAVGTLAGGIAHDFNNILGGIIGYTELAQDEIPPEMRSQHYLSQIFKACYRAKDLILQILSFARQSAVERQALELFQAQPDRFDLLITDQTMPKMTGTALSKKVLESRPDIPVILCIGFSENVTEEQAKWMGRREFLLKPLSRREMALAIRRVLERTG